MKVLSLDQCFLSSFAINKNREPRFCRVIEAIKSAVKGEKLICPAHFREVAYESSLLSAIEMEKIFTLQNHISRGVTFLPFDDVLAHETLSLVRPLHHFDFFGDRFATKAQICELGKLSQENRTAKVLVNQRVNAVPYPPAGYHADQTLMDISVVLSRERAASMYRIVKQILNARSLKTGKEEWDVAKDVGVFLLQKNITNLECHNLLELINCGAWEQIHILRIHTLLWSPIEQDMVRSGRRYKVNDYLDILRISVALNRADALACDSAMKDVVQKTKLGELCDDNVFSMREMDNLADWVSSL